MFLVEYLATRPGVTDLTLAPQARRLRDAIQTARQQSGDDDGAALGGDASADEDEP